MFFVPSGFLNVLGSQLPMLVVSSRFGATDAGQLAIVMQVAYVPAALVGAAIANVYLAEMSARVRRGETDNRAGYLKATKYLLLPSAAVLALLLVALPIVLPVVLGSSWVEVGQFSQALAISVASGFVVSPLSVVFIVYRRALLNLGLDVLRVALNGLAAIAATVTHQPAVMTVLMMAAAQAATYALTWLCGLSVTSAVGGARHGITPEAES